MDDAQSICLKFKGAAARFGASLACCLTFIEKNSKMKKSLGNPVVQYQAVKSTAVIAETIIPWLFKIAVVGGLGYYVYYRFTNRFVRLTEKSNYPQSNVSIAQAKSRADSIIGSISFFDQSEFGTEFNATADALQGLNYNGFVKVYNAFGHQKGSWFTGDKNLVEWIQDQFSPYEIQQLSFLSNGAFFKGAKQLIEFTPEMEDLRYLIQTKKQG